MNLMFLDSVKTSFFKANTVRPYMTLSYRRSEEYCSARRCSPVMSQGYFLQNLFRTISLFIVLSLFSAFSYADNTAVTTIFKQLAKSDIIRADFEQQKKLASLNKTFISNGSLTFAKSNGVLWQIKRPVQADLIVTQKKLVQKTQRTYSQIQIEQSPYSSVATLFLQLMSGDAKAFAKNFNVVSADYTTTGWNMVLTPKSTLFKKLFVRIEAQGQQYVNKIVIQEQANNSTTILFRNHSTQSNQTTQSKLTAAEYALFQLAK